MATVSRAAKGSKRKGKPKPNIKEDIGDQLEEASKHPWVENLTRYGYVARGLLFAATGFVSLQVALGRGGQPTDQTGALAAIAQQPFGRILLIVIVVGLIGFALWGFVRAFFDPLNRGEDAHGLIERAGYVISGLSYAALVIPTTQLILGSLTQPRSQTETTQDMTARVLAHPLGQWVIIAVGLGVIGWSLGQLYQAYTCKFRQDFRSRKMSKTEKAWAQQIGRIGIGARGLVFALVGLFFIQAALQQRADQAKGLDGALLELAQWPGGPWLLTLAALGLIIFGLYSILSARWIDVN